MAINAREAIEADPVLCRLWAYWRQQRGEKSMPARADIDPIDIPKILPHLQLIEAVGGRFRFRVTGTAIVAVYGAELTGTFVDDFLPPDRSAIATGHFKMVQDAQMPLVVRNTYERAGGALFVATRLILPLWTGGATPVGIILMGATYEFASTFAAKAGLEANTAMNFAEREFVAT
jgi:hypothetical protein